MSIINTGNKITNLKNDVSVNAIKKYIIITRLCNLVCVFLLRKNMKKKVTNKNNVNKIPFASKL